MDAAPPADVGHPVRRGLLPRTLGGRLVAFVVALVVVLVGAIAMSTFYAFRSFSYERLDKLLTPVADFNQAFIANCLEPRGCPRIVGSEGVRAPETEWIVVLDENANTVVRIVETPSLKFLRLTPAQRRAFLGHPDSSRTVTTTDGVEVRATGRVVQAQGGDRVVVVTALSTNELHRNLRQLVSIELIIGLGAVGVAVLATSYGVRRSLRNLNRVTGTAREVTRELSPEGAGLDRRVPVTGDATEVGQLAESMNTLLSAVEAQFQARLASEQRMRQFLADASHELRTPLTSIRGYAELARLRGAAELSDDLSRIEAEGTRMSRLVEDLLTLARTDREEEPEQWHLIDVGELIDDVVGSTRAAFPQRRIVVRTAPGLSVLGVHDQLVRIVRNLLTNAAVHTDTAGPITVQCHRAGGHVVIEVIDAGPGLPPEQAAHVFERFWRADKARSRSRGGSGLGLSIVVSLVEAHGGSVGFESTVQGGSTVTVRLPAATG